MSHFFRISRMVSMDQFQYRYMDFGVENITPRPGRAGAMQMRNPRARPSFHDLFPSLHSRKQNIQIEWQTRFIQMDAVFRQCRLIYEWIQMVSHRWRMVVNYLEKWICSQNEAYFHDYISECLKDFEMINKASECYVARFSSKYVVFSYSF